MPAAPPPASKRHGGKRNNSKRIEPNGRPLPHNPAFDRYYRSQGVVPEGEWEDFLGALRTPLPVVVRVNKTKLHWRALEDSFVADGRWEPLSWLPSAWQCAPEDYDDGLREQCSALNKGYALRFQEAASLVPPLLLALEPQHTVLDMCAAPGSKTLECLELMRDENGVKDGPDEGVMVANDADAERAFELLPIITRKARHSGTLVTLGNAAKFPPLLRTDTDEQLLFDRVVCDVPCSGDGTLRKRPAEWMSWSVGDGLSLHAKQVRLLCRGLHLLKKGGRLAYSTCSMNPIENEAVVVAALAKFGKDVALVPNAGAALRDKGLTVSLGVCDWVVPESTGSQVWRSWSDVPAEQRRPSGPLVESMFPPLESGEVREVLPTGCMRLYPHLINGSGFFVAIFEKLHHWHAPNALPAALQSIEQPRIVGPDSLSRLAWRARNHENHYEVVDETSALVRAVTDFYGMRTVPKPLLAEFNVKGRLTQLNLINDSLLKLLTCRLECKASPLLVSVGVPLFKPLPSNFMTEVDLPSRWRPALEGAALLAPLMTKRVLRLQPDEMRVLLTRRLVPIGDLPGISGVDSCGGLLGGVVAGLADGSFWAPCVVTGLGLELFANSDELSAPSPVLRPAAAAEILQSGPGYVVVAKPAGLRTEDALRTVQRAHPAAELVSRLDKPTSGCLLVPTSAESAKILTAQFAASGTVDKVYLAIVWGRPPEAGVIDAPLSLSEDGGGSRYRAYVDEDGAGGKASETRYRTLWTSDTSAGTVALLAARPVTGRTHQIRCHAAYAGFPLLGDAKYGGASPPVGWGVRLPLHCLRVRARDELGGAIDARVGLFEDFAMMLDAIARDAVAGKAEGPSWNEAVAGIDEAWPAT